ncbi:Protein hgh1, partial [Spiromyces aspiralis]
MVGVKAINPTELGFGLDNFTALPLHYASQEPYTNNLLELGDMPYQVAFGFTEDEVRRLIATRVFPGPDKEAMVDIALNVARSWYDGYYVFKNYRIYNPWSVMNFIKSLTEGGACINEAEILTKAQPYWIDTGSTEILTDMYYKIIRINPSISRVLLRMGLDYFNLKDSIEPSESPRPSVRVELIDSFDEHTIQKATPYFDEQTKDITIKLATLEDQDSLIENPTLDKFMTMAYCYGYLTIIEGKYLAIPNWEVLTFWSQIITDETGSPDEPYLLRDFGRLTESLVSGDLSKFCDGLKRNFLDYLAKIDPGTSEYFYREILFMQVRLGIDPSQYDCHSEFSVDSGRANNCMIPKAKGSTGILLEIKRTRKGEIIDYDCSSSSSSSRDDDSMMDVTKLPYCHLKECLGEGIEQIEKNHHLQAFDGKCSRVLVVVPAFCGKKYLVCFKSYDYDGSKWVPSADQLSAKHKSCLLPPDATMSAGPASYIVGFTSPKSDHFGLLVSKASSVIPALISLFKEEELTVHDVVRSLVNLTTETSTLQYMQSEDTIRAVVQKITDPLCVVADLFCMLLSNMNKYEAIAVSLVQLEVPEVAQLASTSRALDQLTDVFVKGADKQYNKHAQFHFLASVFADLTMVPAGREYFLTKSKFDSKAHITKLIVFSEHKDLIRRGGVATAMKNVCFEKAYHSEILSEDGINMLPYILLPLCGPEEYDIDDMDGMPDEVQLLGDDKKRESDPTIRKTLVEALILLTTTLNGREFLRARK